MLCSLDSDTQGVQARHLTGSSRDAGSVNFGTNRVFSFLRMVYNSRISAEEPHGRDKHCSVLREKSKSLQKMVEKMAWV